MRRAAALLLLVLLAGCAGPRAMTLATTTSTDNTGLLAYLLAGFEAAHGLEVKVVAVGSGRALELGERGDAEVVLSHAPPLERSYLANGSYVRRVEVMHNQFLLVGPDTDPAGTRGAANVTEALLRIRDAGAPFVSRGDRSGTHLREQELWALAAVDARGLADQPWYRSVGQGMEATLRIASELQAYTLSDDGTYYAAAPPALAILRANEPPLRNQYSVLVPAASRQPALAEDFAAWFASPATQARIGAFEVNGHRLFTPNAGLVEP